MNRYADARAVNSSTSTTTASTTTTRTELKLDGESDELPEALHDRFDWIVAGNQVGIQWRRSHGDKISTLCHVGDPSPANSQDCALRLWIGVSETTQELLVVMIQSVRLRIKRGKARRMFLVVPAENLSLGTSVAGFQPLALDQVPECLFERPSDRPSANGNGFLHIRFALGPTRKSTVIMPARPHEGLVRGTALSLLDRLKSLSEAPILDVYLRFNSYAQQKLLKLQRAATDNCDRLTCYITPVFDVNAMYLGDRDGGFDLWAAQGCWQQQLDHSPAPKSRKRQASNLLETPPRYVPRDSARDPPIYDDCLDQPLTTRAQLTAADGPDQTPPLEIIVPRSCTPVSRVKEFLSQTSSVSRVCETPLARAKEPAPVPPTPDLIVAPPVAVSDIALPGSVPPTAATLTTESAPGPLSVVPLTSVSLPEHPSARFFRDMPEWLLRAWGTSPVAHYTCIVPLLALGYSAALGDADKYEKQRAMCTERFVSWRAKAGPSVNVSTKKSLFNTLSYEIRDLVSWMLVVDPLADSGLFDSLVNLEGELQSVMELSHAADDQLSCALKLADDEFDQQYTRLLRSKALIVVQVCFRYGQKAWRSRVDVAEKMLGQATAILERDV